MIANIKMNNGRLLVAVVAIIAMLACCLAVAVPSETDAANTPPSLDDVPQESTSVVWIDSNDIDAAQVLKDSLKNDTVTAVVINGVSISITGNDNSIPAGKSVYFINEAGTSNPKITVESGAVLEVAGAFYNQVGTSDTNSGISFQGTVNFIGHGMAFSVCAASVTGSTSATAYFTSIDTAVDGASGYQHIYAADINDILPYVTENTNYTDSEGETLSIRSLGDKTISGNVNLGDVALVVTTGTVTIGANASITANSIVVSSSATIDNKGSVTVLKNISGEGTFTNTTGIVNLGSGVVPGINISGGTITYDGSRAAVVTDDDDISTADKDVIIFIGNELIITGSTDKTIVVNNLNDTSENAVTLSTTDGSKGSIIVAGTVGKLTITAGTGEETATATLSNVSGNFTITDGSIIMNGSVVAENDGTIDITGPAYVDKSFTIGAGVTLNITGTGTLEVPSGAILNINGTMDVDGPVTNNGTINATGPIDIASGVDFINNGDIYTSSSTNIKGTIKGTAPVEGLGLSTNMDAISGDLPLSGYAFLTSDLTIPYGKSISVNGGAILDLRGHTLTVLGTLNVSSTGTVIDSAASSVDGIQIGTTGVINNAGVIGATNAPVTVSLASGEPGSVTLANVNGLSFGYKRIVVSSEKVEYYLTIAGDASKRGTDNGKITINDTVYASDALSIGSKVDMILDGTLNLDNGVELTVTSSGTASGTGSVVLGVGSVVDVDGRADIAVSAKTGDYQTSAGSANLGTTTVTLANVKGIELTLTSSNYSKDNALWNKQRMEISGAMDNFGSTGTADSPVTTGIIVTGTAGKDVETSEDYLGLVVTGTLTITDDIDTWTVLNGAEVTVEGTVSYGEDNKIDGNNSQIDDGLIGTKYSVQTTVDGVTSTTYYITSFQAAVENIANAYEGLTVYGDVEVDFDFELGAEQTITGDGKMTIDEGATVTVANDANMEFNTITVDGKLVVYVNGNVGGTIDYDVRSVDDEYTVTYSGFAVALSEAQPGSTITVEGAITVDEDVTIPEGVTVVITNTSSLAIGTTDANTSCDLTVNGTLNVMGTVEVDGDVSVSGAMDVTEAQEFTASEITVTGTVTSFGDAIDEMKINAVKYEALDGNTVYTNLASAAEVVNAYDVNKYIYLLGTVSDSAAVTLDGTTLYVNGTARLGTITLDEASIILGADGTDGTFTGTVAGLSGTEGATVDTAVAFTAVKNAVIANTVIPNESNVNEYTVYVAQYVASGSSATEDENIAGAVSVETGVLEVRTMTFTGDKNTLTVGANATAVIAGGNTLTAATDNNVNGVTVDGTMTVNGTLKVTGTMDVTGTLDIAKAERGDAARVEISFTAANGISGDYAAHPENWAVLNIMGTMNISAEENREGTVVINGILAVGSAPTTLGVGGTVTGPIATGSIGDNGYIKAYAGADLSGAQILIDTATGESQADRTVFYINGTEYMTVYVDGSEVSFDEVLANEEFDLVGYETKVSDSDGNVTYDIQRATDWNSDADLNQGLADSTVVGSIDAAYTKVSASEVRVTVSVGEGISLYIDDIRMTGNYVMLSVGTHNVYAVVNPGFAGEVTISFNGSAVEGTFTVTPEMSSAAYEGTPAISATGNITADTPEIVVPGTSSGDDDMGLTDYLLIILVILIVIMAIMVAFRLMRS